MSAWALIVVLLAFGWVAITGGFNLANLLLGMVVVAVVVRLPVAASAARHANRWRRRVPRPYAGAGFSLSGIAC